MFLRMQLQDYGHLWAFAVLEMADFADVTRLCNYCLRFECTIAAAVFRRDEIMQLLSEIRIPLVGSIADAVFRKSDYALM
ncbi:hypothetical protein CEXT_247381 [Caerostris extrusa]|uniref:Uncharacterized protein n=1 Tax=Caerostris extrusa TaxID=172846 RepID=A0AAV4NNJ0_CAEEX|nr:hypothetical protein CEXT_247381 [Caerostris extrusa]